MSMENKGTITKRFLVTSEPDRSGNLICDGTSDETEINLAFTYLTSGRTWKETVKLIGDFTTDGTITIPSYTILDATEAKITLANSSDVPMVTITGNDIEIWGGWFDGNKANQAAGDIVFVNGGTFLKVLGCTLEDSWRDGVRFDGGGAWQSNSVVRECTILNAGSSGVWSQDGQQISMVKNHIKNSANYGIVLREDCSAHHNTILDTIAAEAIYSFSFSASIIGNHINREVETISSGQAGIFVGGFETLCAGNRVWYAGHYGIQANADGSLIVGNQTNGCGRHGIYITGDLNTIDGNISNDNSASGANTFDNIHLAGTASQNVVSNNSMYGESETWFPRYGINIAADTCVGNLLEHNIMTTHNTGRLNDAGTDTAMEFCQFQFTEPIVGVIVTTSPTGVEVDANTEEALAWGQLPSGIQEVQRIRIWAVALDAPVGAGGQMHLEIEFNAGASNAAYNTANKSWTLANWDSDEADYVANDVVHWIIEDGDVGNELVNLAGQDSFEIFAKHEAADDPDGATDAVFRVVEVQYV